MEPNMKCTNRFLEEGYKLTDDTGQTIAVLVNGEFRRWEAGSWRSRFDRLFGGRRGLRALESARKSALIKMLKRKSVSDQPL